MRNLVLFAVLLLAGTDVTAADLVKKSSSGICHDTSSPWYSRTKNFDSFSSLESCLRSGGRRPKGSFQSHTKKAPSPNQYSRSHFGHGWADKDSDCQNERQEALIDASTVPVVFANSSRCRVIHGRWISPFTGSVITNAGDIDIDHVVPLSWAWKHGADAWNKHKRQKFANDRRNLWPVEAGLNRQKSDSGPDEWLPPANQCQYISRFKRIVLIYGLELTPSEKGQLDRLLSVHCGAVND